MLLSVIRIAVALLWFLVALAQAQTWPTKPVRLIQTLGVGGGSEPFARLVAQKLGEALGQPVIVETQGGAGGAIGLTTVARAAPDGYTLALASGSSLVLRRFLAKNVPYETLRDFTPIILTGETVSCVVAAGSLGLATLPEVIDYARRNPGKVAYGSSGIGTTHHLSGVMVEQLSGAQMLHVPYKGGGEALNGLLSGQVQIVFGIVGTMTSHMKAGTVRMLAINGGKRFYRMPDVPTVGEVLPGYARPPSWNGFVGPAGMPRPVVQRLYDEIHKTLAQPEMVERIADFGFVVDTAGPEEFAAHIRSSMELYAKAVRAAKIEPE